MKKATVPVVGHVGPAQRGDRMEAPHALAALAALGQPTRLEIFRLLISSEPDGLACRRNSGKDRLPAQHSIVTSEHHGALRIGAGRKRWTLNCLSRRR